MYVYDKGVYNQIYNQCVYVQVYDKFVYNKYIVIMNTIKYRIKLNMIFVDLLLYDYRMKNSYTILMNSSLCGTV